MTEARIVRVTRNSECTAGVFVWRERAIAVTLELPWRENKRQWSCIPEGVYKCIKVKGRTLLSGEKLDETYEITNVPDRDGILFHIGNAPKDTKGCVLIAQNFGVVRDEQQMILNSRTGFAEWLKQMKYPENFNLEIVSI